MDGHQSPHEDQCRMADQTLCLGPFACPGQAASQAICWAECKVSSKDIKKLLQDCKKYPLALLEQLYATKEMEIIS